jgi:4-amino-4-deoxy-L-arabinose transferase-like glycosyltransferase
VTRCAALLYERGTILNAFTEKSNIFAWTYIRSGTFGFIPGQPSAYTQPLYGFFLVPIYWIFGRHWWAIGAVQIVVAVAVAWVVYEIGRRVASPRVGLTAALLATLHPFLIWHDVHVNREILDQLVGALAVLLALVAVDRRSWRWAALLGVVLGLAILGNSRLILLPIAIAVYIAWRIRGRQAALLAGIAVVAGAAVAIAPWAVRNKVELGCFALTTDARALWKANNRQTYGLLDQGQWIDAATDPAGAPLTPIAAYREWTRGAHPVPHVNECAFERYYLHQVVGFWKHHPGEKAKLAGQATALLWDPRTNAFVGAVEHLGQLRRYAEGAYMSVAFALALVGFVLVPRWLAALALLFLAYETGAAAIFAGQTRYRVAWDFLLMLLASAAATWLSSQRRSEPAPGRER